MYRIKDFRNCAGPEAGTTTYCMCALRVLHPYITICPKAANVTCMYAILFMNLQFLEWHILSCLALARKTIVR